MIKKNSLVDGIGNKKITENYYDNWSGYYEKTLNRWNYQAPKKCVNILAQKIKLKPERILDLACGTGFFGEEMIKRFSSVKIDGSDISIKSLNLARQKNIYRKLIKKSFESNHNSKNYYDIVSMIGSMTYCKKHDRLFELVFSYLTHNGYFIFTQRIDLWNKFKLYTVLENFSEKFKIIYKSKPINYLPNNKDFSKKIKIYIVLLKKFK